MLAKGSLIAPIVGLNSFEVGLKFQTRRLRSVEQVIRVSVPWCQSMAVTGLRCSFSLWKMSHLLVSVVPFVLRITTSEVLGHMATIELSLLNENAESYPNTLLAIKDIL